ncbi:polysaccharide biosynthesis tyrosine autokinase [Aestuariimicrobium ganziense]|uniref:polysaccharide biosynthesis tyrosine autokinase n=1 Tax=Aestuariimicrobium ganziense TaxID=2773677 RepID=UPI0019436CF1|nr:polysaccharide biosynthesis tyrosine autokinase [Aestuariimicrobium ganziense]
MTLRDYLRIFRRRWLIILACTLVAAGVVFAITDESERPALGYAATATLVVDGENAQGNLSRIALYVTTGDIPVRAAAALGHQGDPAVLASELEVTPDPAAGALTITARSDQAERATAVANTFADETVKYFDANRQLGQVRVLQRATPVAETPSGGFVVPPGRLPRTLIAAALGLLLGAALALIVDHLDSRLRTRDQVHKVLRMPVIAEVPKLLRTRKNSPLPVVSQPLGPYADAYRSARTAITHLPAQQLEGNAAGEATERPGAGKVVLVSSGFASEGKTTSVANLAASFAETGKSVIVVDGDLRKPDAHLLLDVPEGAGVTDYLSNPTDFPLRAVIRPTNVAGVEMITAGTQLDSPTSLVTRMGPLVDDLCHQADVIIVDSSPLLAASDVYDLLPLVDAVLLVVRSGRLTTSAGERIAELLGRFRTPVIGAMLIGAPVSDQGYGYGYGSGYGYGNSKQRAKKRQKAAGRAPAAQPPAGAGEAGAPPPQRAARAN